MGCKGTEGAERAGTGACPVHHGIWDAGEKTVLSDGEDGVAHSSEARGGAVMSKEERFILWFEEIGAEDVPLVGLSILYSLFMSLAIETADETFVGFYGCFFQSSIYESRY